MTRGTTPMAGQYSAISSLTQLSRRWPSAARLQQSLIQSPRSTESRLSGSSFATRLLPTRRAGQIGAGRRVETYARSEGQLSSLARTRVYGLVARRRQSARGRFAASYFATTSERDTTQTRSTRASTYASFAIARTALSSRPVLTEARTLAEGRRLGHPVTASPLRFAPASRRSSLVKPPRAAGAVRSPPVPSESATPPCQRRFAACNWGRISAACPCASE